MADATASGAGKIVPQDDSMHVDEADDAGEGDMATTPNGYSVEHGIPNRKQMQCIRIEGFASSKDFATWCEEGCEPFDKLLHELPWPSIDDTPISDEVWDKGDEGLASGTMGALLVGIYLRLDEENRWRRVPQADRKKVSSPNIAHISTRSSTPLRVISPMGNQSMLLCSPLARQQLVLDTRALSRLLDICCHATILASSCPQSRFTSSCVT